jgi:hypothetical protein
MDSVWPVSDNMFGEPVTLNGAGCRAIVADFDFAVTVGQASNRSRQVTGTMTLRLADWIDSGAKQGSHVVIPSMPALGTIRVASEPARNRSTVRVTLTALVSN